MGINDALEYSRQLSHTSQTWTDPLPTTPDRLGRKTVFKSTPQVELDKGEERLLDIQNSTLGVSTHFTAWSRHCIDLNQFQKIFILSMPNRSDKRDGLTLAAFVTGLVVEYIDGVDGTAISQKAYPVVWSI